jgi:hypothetical protein
MMSEPRHFDPDPRPRRSPRLYAAIDRVPGTSATSSRRPTPPTPARLERLRRDLAIMAALERGMSQRTAAKVFGLSQPGILKAYRRMISRKSRV